MVGHVRLSKNEVESEGLDRFGGQDKHGSAYHNVSCFGYWWWNVSLTPIIKLQQLGDGDIYEETCLETWLRKCRVEK